MPLPPAIEAQIAQRLGATMPAPGGAAPGAAPGGAAPVDPAAGTGVQPGAAPGTPGAANPTPTDVEKAMATDTPADPSQAAPIFKVKIGDAEREFTPEQIAGLTTRYRDLNFTHAQAKPLLDLADKMIGSSGGDYSKVAQFFGSLLDKSNEHSPTLGGAAPGGGKAQGAPVEGPEFLKGIDAKMRDWMQRNSITEPPPGFAELMGAFNGMHTSLSTQNELLHRVISQAGKVHQDGKDAQDQAKSMKTDAVKRQIQNNLNQTQQKLGLPDDSFQNFMAFAYERGYTVEDFVNPALSESVMTDFKNSMNTPEFNRLMDIHKRRTAFVGNTGGTPSGGGAQPLDAGKQFFDGMTNKVMAKKGIG